MFAIEGFKIIFLCFYKIMKNYDINAICHKLHTLCYSETIFQYVGCLIITSLSLISDKNVLIGFYSYKILQGSRIIVYIPRTRETVLTSEKLYIRMFENTLLIPNRYWFCISTNTFMEKSVSWSLNKSILHTSADISP